MKRSGSRALLVLLVSSALSVLAFVLVDPVGGLALAAGWVMLGVAAVAAILFAARSGDADLVADQPPQTRRGDRLEPAGE